LTRSQSIREGQAPDPSLPKLFTPITVKGVTFRNRLVNGPTSLFTCDGHDGLPTAFHMAHLGSRAVGGAGLVLTEAAAVSPEGRPASTTLVVGPTPTARLSPPS
jgi:2,4-dienoyl-CoA reductase-like NADH-dependent reductase (Old Yellow Enzyme family)